MEDLDRRRLARDERRDTPKRGVLVRKPFDLSASRDVHLRSSIPPGRGCIAAGVACVASIPASCNASLTGVLDAETVSFRVLLVDDSEQFLRAAASSLGRNGMEIVGTATSSETALQQVEGVRPDVVLVDVGLGEESGFDLVLELVDAFPHLAKRVVLISTRGEDDYGELVEASPAAGFILKSELSASAIHELVSAGDS